MVKSVPQRRNRQGCIIPAEERYLPEDVRTHIGQYVITKRYLCYSLIGSIKTSALTLWKKTDGGIIRKETVIDNAEWQSIIRPMVFNLMDKIKKTWKSMSTLDRNMEYTVFLARQSLSDATKEIRNKLMFFPDRYTESNSYFTYLKETRLRFLNIIEVLEYIELWNSPFEKQLHLYLKNTIP